MARARLGARRHFGENQTALVQRLLPFLVVGRIEDVDSAGDHADRACGQRAVMRGTVYSAREAGNHDQVLLSKVVGEAPGKAACRGGRIACADDRDRLPVEQVEVPLGHQQGRRVFQLGERAGIETLPQRKELRAELFGRGDLALGLVPGSQRWRLAPAAPCEIRHSLER